MKSKRLVPRTLISSKSFFEAGCTDKSLAVFYSVVSTHPFMRYLAQKDDPELWERARLIQRKADDIEYGHGK